MNRYGLAVLCMALAGVLGCHLGSEPQNLVPDAGSVPADGGSTGPTSANWHKVIGTLGNNVIAFSSVGDTVFAATGAKAGPAIANGGVFLSQDQGTTWKPTALSGTISGVWATPSEVYASTLDQGLMKSVDMGATWTRVTIPNAGTTIFNAVAMSGSRLLVGVGPAVFISDDNGATWTKTLTGMPGFSYVTQFLAESGKVVATLKGGVVASSDNGSTWVRLEEGLPYNPEVYGAARVNDSLFVSTNEGVYRASFSGGPFQRVANGMSNKDVYAILSHESELFAGVGAGAIGSAFLSTDEGNTWSPFNTGLPDFTPILSLGVVGDSLLAGSGSEVWRTALGPRSPPPDTGPLTATVDRVPVGACPYWVAFDDTHLYFSTIGTASGPSVSQPGSLMRAPLAGGLVETLQTLQPSLEYVAVTANHVWWTVHGDNENTGVVRREPKSGGPVEVMATNQPGFTQFEATATHVWFTSFDFMRIPVGGGPVERFYVSPDGRMDHFVFDGTDAYFGENSFTPEPWRLRLTDKTRQLLTSTPASGWDTLTLTADADYVYTLSVTHYVVGSPRAIFRTRKDGTGTREKLLDVPAQTPPSLLLAGGSLYFAQGRTLVRIPKAPPVTPPEVVMSDVNMERMFVHGGRLYWTDCFLQEIRSAPFPPP